MLRRIWTALRLRIREGRGSSINEPRARARGDGRRESHEGDRWHRRCSGAPCQSLWREEVHTCIPDLSSGSSSPWSPCRGRRAAFARTSMPPIPSRWRRTHPPTRTRTASSRSGSAAVCNSRLRDVLTERGEQGADGSGSADWDPRPASVGERRDSVRAADVHAGLHARRVRGQLAISPDRPRAPDPQLGGFLFVGRTKEGFSTNKFMVGYYGWFNERSAANDAFLPILADGARWTAACIRQQARLQHRCVRGPAVEVGGVQQRLDRRGSCGVVASSQGERSRDLRESAGGRGDRAGPDERRCCTWPWRARYAGADDGICATNAKPESFLAQSQAVDTGHSSTHRD